MKKYRFICPLTHFQIQWGMLVLKHKRSKEETLAIFKKRKEVVDEGIELFNGIKIRSCTKKEIEDIKPQAFFPVGLSGQHVPLSYLLEKVVSGERVGVENKTAEEMRKIVLALRLLKEGYFYGDDVFCIDSETGYFTSSSREGSPPIAERATVGYALNFEDFPELKRLIKKLQKIDFDKRKSLKLACNRFQRAYQEYHFEDKLIDYMIGFEALFLKGERTASPKGDIIAIACSSLLGENSEKREDIKNTLKTAYSMRNSIVHGGEYKKEINPYSVVDEICEYLRQAIIRFLD